MVFKQLSHSRNYYSYLVKTLSKILLATLGVPFVILMLFVAIVRRLFRGSYFNNPETIFTYSQVTWDEVWQRPQQYAWLASKQLPVLYCCPVQLHNLLFLWGKWKPVRHVTDGGRQLLILSPLIFSGHFKFRIIHEINSLITSLHLKLAQKGDGDVYALVNTPFALPLLKLQFYCSGSRHHVLKRLVYDVIDDFTVFDWSPAFGKEFDESLTRLADTVIAGTDVLAERRDAAFIPCGVDYELFSKRQPAPDDLKNMPRPIIGYFGTFSERIDLEIISRLADHFTHGSIALIGPVHLPAHALPRRPNIHYLGLRRHAELPACAQAFDVGLIPFRITTATVKLNPVKTLEYLAAGLPVVVTRLPDLEKFYSHVVHIAESPTDFVLAVEHALEHPDPDRIATGIEMARAASWESMVERINEVLLTPPASASAQIAPTPEPAFP